MLRSHHEWVEIAQERAAGLGRLPVSGSYLINTSENHSERHGPYAAWRRELTERVKREGRAIDAPLAATFDLDLDQIRAVSGRFVPPGRAGSARMRRRAALLRRP